MTITMHAARYDHYGPPSVLGLHTVAVPEPPAGHLRVRVHATSVNAVDLMLRAGGGRPLSGNRFPRGVGLDFVGEVDAVGEGDSDWRPKDRVWGGIPDYFRGAGTAAEYVVVPVNHVARAPRTLDPVSAAALPTGGVTALIALHDHARLRAGQTVLVRGAAGGFGHVCVQLAHAMGARVTALAGAGRLAAVRDLGAAEALDYRRTSPKDLPLFDVVVDAVGTELAAYRRLGRRTVTIAFGSPRALAAVAASTAHGSRRIRTFSGKLLTPTLQRLTAHVEAGDLRPSVAAVHPLTEAAEAHRSAEAGGSLGKHVIRIS
ncbi:NAD(P)-dependent alcohol dehydrogenase [Micromonospora rubida]|uniref:NAD(P)-dependent alcohol dehydrogenase n=1 Tax=Micromonospora rubida TaxID=2697657 RepID=A0ABW7ST44_9ACTN